MKDLVYSTLIPSAKKWWINFLLGLLFIALGIWVFLTPLTSYAALTIFFSLAMVTAGLFEIFASLFYRKYSKKWWLYFAGGTFDLLIGGYLLLNPFMTMAILPYILAIWLLFRGAVAIGASLQLRSYEIKGWGWTLLPGICTLIFSILIMLNPVIGGISIVFTTALAFLTLGLFNISAAYHLKKLQKRIRNFQFTNPFYQSRRAWQ